MTMPRRSSAALARGRARLPVVAALLVLPVAGLLLLGQAAPAGDGGPPRVTRVQATDSRGGGSPPTAEWSPAPGEPVARPILDPRATPPRAAVEREPTAAEAVGPRLADSGELNPSPSVEVRAALPARHDVLAARLGWSPEDARIEALRSWIEGPGGRRPDVLLETFGREVAEAVAREVPPLAVDGATQLVVEVDLQGRPLAPGTAAAER